MDWKESKGSMHPPTPPADFAPHPARAWMTAAEMDAAIQELEQLMPDLQHRCRDLFAYASAWADYHDAIMRHIPGHLRADATRRLHRIGVRWGVVAGVRMTGQFPALKRPA